MKNEIAVPIAEVEALILACWDANEIPCLIGVPGIGKTDVAADAARTYSRALAKLRGMPETGQNGQVVDYTHFAPFFARSFATMTAEDFTVPDRDPTGAVIHKPVGAYRVACDRAAVILNDEFNRTGHGTQNAALTMLQNRILGDFVFHPDTRLICAMNDAEDEGGDGAHERLTAFNDRIVDIRVEATFKGWFDYATTRIGQPGSSLRALALDYAFSADRSRRLLSLRPEPGQEKRPSPRAISKGLAVYDAALTRGLDGEKARTLLGGCIGDETASAFLTIRKLREKLPSADEIENDPLNALLPVSTDIAWAAAGLLGVVASKKPDPAWMYLGRMKELAEVQVATGRMLIRSTKIPTDPRAVAVRDRMLGLEGLARAGQPVPGMGW